MSAVLSENSIAVDMNGGMTLEQAKGLITAAAELHQRLMELGYSPDSANGRDPMLTYALAKVFTRFADAGEEPLYGPGDCPPHFFIFDKLEDAPALEDAEQRIVDLLCEEFAVPLCIALVRDDFRVDPA